MKKRILSVASTFILGFSIASAQTDMPAKPINGGVLNGKATSLAKPVYPSAARAVNAEGAVSVQVVIDEEGNIASATAISGHPLLRQSAEQAALQSKFAPTKLTGQPVRVSGIITYNFVAGASATSWVKVGYDLASLEKFASVNASYLIAMSERIPKDWTSERENLSQLSTLTANTYPMPSRGEGSGIGSAVVKSDEKITTTVENSADGTVVKKMKIVRSTDAPSEATAEQISIVQNLTSSLHSRLGSDPKAAWQFNLGIALGRAFSNVRNTSDPQGLVDSLRQQIAAAPADIAPVYLENVNKIVSILETRERTEEQRQQIGQLLSSLFKN
jgi:TonB family protein